MALLPRLRARRSTIPPRNVRDRDLVKAYLAEHPLALTIAAWALFSGIVSLLLAGSTGDDASALEQTLPLFAVDVWAIMYAAGGGLVLAGMVRLEARLEVAGCSLLAGSQAVNVYAIAVVRGLEPAFVSGIGFGVAVGCLIRAHILARRHRRP